LRRLQRVARGNLESFVLVDGSHYYYDPASPELFLHALDLHLGRGEKWPEPPEGYRKMCEARDPAAALEKLRPENPQVAFVNPADLFDPDALVRERRLVPIAMEPPETLTE
jgi:hypothetical protein